MGRDQPRCHTVNSVPALPSTGPEVPAHNNHNQVSNNPNDALFLLDNWDENQSRSVPVLDNRRSAAPGAATRPDGSSPAPWTTTTCSIGSEVRTKCLECMSARIYPGAGKTTFVVKYVGRLEINGVHAPSGLVVTKIVVGWPSVRWRVITSGTLVLTLV